MSDRPNVLLVMTDQQRWDTLGSAGGPVETANLDHLAAQGTTFTHAYSATPSCTPARASLLTGQDPWHTGILGMGAGQPPMAGLENTLPEALADAGYHTQGVGKMHFSPQRALHGFHATTIDESLRVEEPGFTSDYTQWFERHAPADVRQADHGLDFNSWLARPFHTGEHLHPSTWTVTESIRFLERRDPTRPFFLMTSFARPHSPYDPPAFYYEHYLRRHHTGDLPPAVVGDWASVHDVGGAEGMDPNAWRGRRTADEIGRARAGYYGSIHHIDHQIGRLMRYLRDRRLDAETLVVFTADHGDMLGDHHLWRKTYAYEGSAHVPLVVRLPAGMRSAGDAEVVDDPVCLQDVMPTILDACGVDVPASVDGASTLPLVTGERVPWREFVHGEHSTCYHPSQEMQYLTDGAWKYVWFPRGDGPGSPREQLFDLRSDPYEERDLAPRSDHAAVLRRWRARLVDVLAPRDAGLTDGGALVPQDGRPPLVSPHAASRVAERLA
ncbi:sulfatase [Beutenbergia cavernae DSM 12333]|uniref:Sulfatase n=1 Tax=Beutenbergia cavernae (strain ATCC BAA-8 / DSM 12333 / CCUG 43141 / JCM 11478 / NBRC 16432 / NCIMB 13614 / HKI 0122) TaxID=471853 RepID=C5BWB0_BEUC1|nr:arylsulfatase [Beutenbergia cavernae]ACQ78568.1 sulfatase [Beutenbergia cavernae DSM 12333]